MATKDDDDSDLLWDWQAGRCACCGTDRRRNVLDHDHITGLVRGYLCTNCNVTEGVTPHRDGMYAKYRRRNPATILGIKWTYTNIFGETPLSPAGIRARMTQAERDAQDKELADLVNRIWPADEPDADGDAP